MISSSVNKIKASFKTLLIIFLVVAAIIVTYSVIQLKQSKQDLLNLMQEESHSLLESILSASNNALLSYEVIDSEMKSRLVNNANFVKLLLEKNQLTNNLLKQIADQNNIYRINIFNKSGQKIFSNHTEEHTDLEEKLSPTDLLKPIFNNETDTLFLGTKEARYEEGYRFAVAVSAKNRSAIVVNINALDYLEFRKSIGFGALLKNVTQNEGIVYSALQDTNGIIAASGSLNNISSFNEDLFLQNSLAFEKFSSRILTIDSTNIFEAVHPFEYNNNTAGILRIGISAEPLMSINKANNQRVIILGLILFLLGSAILAYIFNKQNFETLKKNYTAIEDYSQKVIENVSDAVVVISENGIVQTFNKAAEDLFEINNNIIDKNFNELISDSTKITLQKSSSISPIKIKIDEKEKYLMISQSKFNTEENRENIILVIRDITEQKKIEEQLNRKERLAAMGELASGVAHEIRNPLNTISTITQQLNKDFEPIKNSEEFHSLASLVHKEIIRINETIKSFLTFSKPSTVKKSKFILSELINKIEKQYKPMLSENNVELRKIIEWDGEVNWDENQIRQVLMNLIQNSFDAIDNKGNIELTISKNLESIEIKIKDNGPGIPHEIKNKIFNLYYTSKASGSGIGLSIVQKIVFEHGGTIEFSSKEDFGTTFTIHLPINPILSQV